MATLSDLLKTYIRICDSEKNVENVGYFQQTRSILMEKFRGVPKPLTETGGKIPFVYWLSLDLWRDLLQLDIERYYTDPLYYLEHWLRMRIFYVEHFEDCNCCEKFIPIWLGEGFEAALFGCQRVYSSAHEPAIDRSYKVLETPENLTRLKLPEFSDHPQMDLARKFYREIKNVVDEYGIEVGFVDWHYGPTALAIFLRGFENLMLDFPLHPGFVADLMAFIVEARMRWSRERDAFLGTPRPTGGLMYNDDVCTPNISPNIYTQQILPYEQQLHDFYGSLAYYHNCGPIDPFLPDIKTFPRIELLHSGPFSDYRTVGEHFHATSPIELHLRPEQDLISCSEEDFTQRLRRIKADYADLGVNAYYVRITTYSHPNLTTAQNVAKLQRWCALSKQILLQP
ncbi:hypothetical protein GF339_10105 [candidate division KSB3 bacterium]|uniref:Uroporphyrinogen decarboxylase (URO-D) domain-containing protein n=1 Tax=candidate division KSB3 bacterium TaxID=2044937 RepID=A0A9D5Q655_9BACT|nr:hypothetical protein [candidate division KSB3 bacterium]MBD3324927.1 hypothetical protein [candidate division KSB3 bacterium]